MNHPLFKKNWMSYILVAGLTLGIVACGGGSGGSESSHSKTNQAVSSIAVSSAATSSQALSSMVTSSIAPLAAKNWGIPEIVEKMPNSFYGVRDPYLASGLNGNVTLAWIENGIWTKSYTPLGGWGEAVKLNADDISSISRGPLVAADNLGNVFVIWTNYKTWVSRYSPGNGWSVAVSFDGNSTGSIALSVNKQGKAAIAWLDWSSSENRIMAVQYAPDSGWGEPVKIASTTINTSEVAVKLNETDDIFVSWYDRVNDELLINYADFNISSGWSKVQSLVTAHVLDNDVNPLPEIVADSANNFWLFWVTRGDMWSSKFQPGVGMTSSVNLIDLAYSINIRQFNAVIGADDSIRLVWSEFHHANLETIATKKYTTTNGWSQTKTLISSSINRSPDVVITSNGDAQILWAVQDGGVHQYDSIYLNADDTQQSKIQTVITSLGGGLDLFNVTADSAGNVWATGVTDGSGEKNIWLNKYE